MFFATWCAAKNLPLHVLINNAGTFFLPPKHDMSACRFTPCARIRIFCLNELGVMAIPDFETTSDGLEKQWGTNHGPLPDLANLCMWVPTCRTLPTSVFFGVCGVSLAAVGPFLLTNLLLPDLRRAAPSRIVNVASEAHKVCS